MKPKADREEGPWPPDEDFWDRLQRLQRKRKIKNPEIAAVAGVVAGTVSNWRQGQRPEGRAVLLLARYFDVPPEWLDPALGAVRAVPRAKQETGSRAVPKKKGTRKNV